MGEYLLNSSAVSVQKNALKRKLILLDIAGDYRSMTGEGVPFRKLGFDSLGSFLQSLPDLIVRKLPTGGMMVALTAANQSREAGNMRNLKSRNFVNPQKPIRRPKQQSINWTPPSRKQNRSKENLLPHHQTRSRENIYSQNRSRDNLHQKPGNNNNSNNNGMDSRRNNNNGQDKYDHRKQNNNHHNDFKKQQKQQKQPKNTPNDIAKSVNNKTDKKVDKQSVSSKVLLEEYCKKKQLEPLSFKIATMGNKGKLR